MCLKPKLEGNIFISVDVYCGSLLLITTLGIPCLEKMDFIAMMIADEVVEGNSMTFEYLE